MKRNMTKMLVLTGTMGLVTTVWAQETIKTTLVSGTGTDAEEGPAMICDGDVSTKWCIDEPENMPYTIILDAGKPAEFAEYGLVTGNDTQDYPDRNPVTWVLSGSDDRQNWTVMDKQLNDRTLRDENEQEYRFKPSRKGKFRYYKFEFTAMAGGTRIQLSEINFHKVGRTAVKTTFVSGTGQLGGGNGPKQLSVENGKLIFKGSVTNSFTDRWSWYGFQVTFDPTANTYEVWKGSDLDVASFTSISVNGTDITDQLSELK